MSVRPTRRQAALAMLAPAAAAAPQTAVPPQTPPSDEVEAVRAQTRRVVEQLREFKVPGATEPSFAFRP